jgi:hypothetical protein
VSLVCTTKIIRKQEGTLMSLKSVEVIQMGGMYHFELHHWLKIYDDKQNEFAVPSYIHVHFLSIFFHLSDISCCLVIVVIFKV